MSADVILFEPIAKINQQIIDSVQRALDGTLQKYEFSVDPRHALETYDRIASFVENDPDQIVDVKRTCTHDPLQMRRPARALAIKDVFRRLYRGNKEIFFTARANGGGINRYELTNWFAIDTQRPVLHLKGNPSNIQHPWWVLSLLSNFAGYAEYYAFGTHEDAHAYYGLP